METPQETPAEEDGQSAVERSGRIAIAPYNNTIPLSIDILFPTRGRPANVDAMFKSLRKTVAKPDRMQVICFIDPDDQETQCQVDRWKGFLAGECQFCCQFITSDSGALADTYNTMLKFSRADIIMYAADDIVFETPAWDEVVRKAFMLYADRILLLWAHDPTRRDQQFPDHGFVSRISTNLLRYLFPLIPSDASIEQTSLQAFTDIWLNDLYKGLDRRGFIEKVTIKHKHWRGDAEIDAQYAKQAIWGNWHMQPSWYKCVQKNMPKDVEVLKKFMTYCEEHPDMVPTGSIDIEDRCAGT